MDLKKFQARRSARADKVQREGTQATSTFEPERDVFKVSSRKRRVEYVMEERFPARVAHKIGTRVVIACLARDRSRARDLLASIDV